MNNEVIVDIKDLTKYFPITSGLIRQKKVAELKAVDGVSLQIHRGETLGLVGESGCGKTTLGKCLLQLYRATSGQVLYGGKDLCKLSNKELRPLRKNLQLILSGPL
jgi:peptide/nickel transport system ATP-binding protein/oligopeptide transport system ATP-binding protein